MDRREIPPHALGERRQLRDPARLSLLHPDRELVCPMLSEHGEEAPHGAARRRTAPHGAAPGGHDWAAAQNLLHQRRLVRRAVAGVAQEAPTPSAGGDTEG